MNKHLHIGPGGVNCNCCFPAPGSKERRLEFRRAKRSERREAQKLEKLNAGEDRDEDHPKG